MDRRLAALQHGAVIRTSRRTVRKARIPSQLAVQPLGLATGVACSSEPARQSIQCEQAVGMRAHPAAACTSRSRDRRCVMTAEHEFRCTICLPTPAVRETRISDSVVGCGAAGGVRGSLVFSAAGVPPIYRRFAPAIFQRKSDLGIRLDPRSSGEHRSPNIRPIRGQHPQGASPGFGCHSGR